LRRILYGVGLVIVLAIALKILRTGSRVEVREHSDAAAAVSVQRGPDGAHVQLDATTRDRIGLQVRPLVSVDLPDSVRGFGRLLDPTALATPVYDYEATRAAFEVADREYRRVQALHRGNINASERDVEAARVAFERERAALQSARARIASLWGSHAVERDDLPALAQSLVSRQVGMARIDLPLGATVSGEPTVGHLLALASVDASPTDAKVLGAAADADPTIQGRGFLLLVEHPPWPPGTALDGWLTVPAAPRAGVVVPNSAVLRHGGSSMVYVQTGDGVFSRRVVHLEHPTTEGWFVTDGIAAGESVVVSGAQQLLSTELGGATEEE
jgi:hypothetical protein